MYRYRDMDECRGWDKGFSSFSTKKNLYSEAQPFEVLSLVSALSFRRSSSGPLNDAVSSPPTTPSLPCGGCRRWTHGRRGGLEVGRGHRLIGLEVPAEALDVALNQNGRPPFIAPDWAVESSIFDGKL